MSVMLSQMLFCGWQISCASPSPAVGAALPPVAAAQMNITSDDFHGRKRTGPLDIGAVAVSATGPLKSMPPVPAAFSK